MKITNICILNYKKYSFILGEIINWELQNECYFRIKLQVFSYIQ